MMQPPSIFDPHLHPREMVLVGCGGTGGHLARALGRLLFHMKALRMSVPTLRIIDPDRVEAKNVGRQLYTPAEVGLYKAEATARRLSCALGLPVEWCSEPFSVEKHLDRHRYGLILIDAVGNHLARREIARATDALLVACGNHRAAGQVSIGNTDSRADFLRYLDSIEKGSKQEFSQLPTAYTLFPNLLEPEQAVQQDEEGDSCAERVMRAEQSLFINDAVASIAAQYIYKLLFREPISTFLTFVDVDALTTRSIPITPNNLRAYLRKE